MSPTSWTAIATTANAIRSNPESRQRPESQYPNTKHCTFARRSPLSPEAKSRFDRLRVVRTELAREKNLPAFVIMHDSTLRRIAQLAPAGLTALGQIKGIGEKKLKLYGEALLKALREK